MRTLTGNVLSSSPTMRSDPGKDSGRWVRVAPKVTSGVYESIADPWPSSKAQAPCTTVFNVR